RMDQWDDADHEQARDQKPDADIHHRFDHDVSCTTLIVIRMPRVDHALSGLAALSPGLAQKQRDDTLAPPLAKPSSRPCSASAPSDVQNGCQVAVGVNLR